MQSSIILNFHPRVGKFFSLLVFWYSLKSCVTTYAFLQTPATSHGRRIIDSTSFYSHINTIGKRPRCLKDNIVLRSKSEGRDSEVENAEESPSLLPGLPPIGASSFSDSDGGTEQRNKSGSSTPVGFVGSGKFELQYTCKLCETRNVHKVSRIAYRQGVVIAVCKGCMAKHLIADNLGWSNYIGGFDGETNIEEYMEANGRGDEVNRVTEEVFGLEQILDISKDSIDSENEEGHFE